MAARPPLKPADRPPVPGMSLEVWSWLREAMVVRPHVVAKVRAALARGQHASADEVARAILGGPGQHTAPPAYTGSVAHGSVVASRCQSQAKRPT